MRALELRLASLLALSLVAAPARAEEYREPLDWNRSAGVFAELLVGYGGQQALAGDHSGIAAGGPAAIVNASFGANLWPGAQISLHAAFATPFGDAGPRGTAGHVGPALHTSLGAWGWLSFGLGLAVAVDHMTSDARFGIGQDLRVGVRVPTGSEHTLAIGLTGMMGRFGDGFIASGGLAIGYQRR